MKFITCADLHIRSNRPQFRKDDYFVTICRKFRQIVYFANKYDADIICAGDLFDSVKVGHKVVNAILGILLELKKKLYVIAGQHDMSFHSLDLSSSPLQTLLYVDKIVWIPESSLSIGGVSIQGCPFGKKIPKPDNKNSMLVIHRSITPSDPPWFLSDALSAKEAFQMFPYRFIISGDYHVPFVKKYKNRILVNCGPMVRQSIDQVELKPRVYLLDTKKITAKPLCLKIEDAETVFALDLVKKKEESKFSEELSELVESLKNKKNRPDFQQTVKTLMGKTEVNENVKNKVNQILGEVLDG